MFEIYNTMTRKIEEFKPVKDNHVSIYVCGPTVYSYIHIGNARPVIFFDMLKNYLIYKGYDVNYVSNITDIDDKIINEAKVLKVKEEELTNKFIEEFIKDTKRIGSKLPDQMPKATNYISEMIDYIDDLIDKGYAYKTKSGVYFKTTKLDSYGSLSKQNKDDLEESVRIENKSDKLDFRDFSLWKNTEEGLSYDSPFGIGRPGWHIECAVMNNDIFGETIDIHGGGTDLIFPHHENENAQTIAHSNHGLANYWMHVGRVDLDNIKMSKSLNNTILVKDLKDPISYRLLILAHHYRNPINYSDELYLEFISMYDKIIRTLKRTRLMFGSSFDQNMFDHEILNKFEKEMDQDLNTPNVITLILEVIKELNKTNSDIIKMIKLYNSLKTILEVLGLMPEIKLEEKTLKSYMLWQQARLDKDYAKADLLRKELLEEGWI
ncbi:cysteine--tRNA ligase [Haploplasma modicum]|uniref:cysteine--tRNA ligase n=1 Tax=Haploplasma modicum TaxID=2150 RepID=UPI00214BBF81|nr:cysteine--tRNA ligase [Haploplasma modicum]MCR1809182.1 cysteine--tRNA ligase [Haploplasma modicum]